jgi:hypothetical protein
MSCKGSTGKLIIPVFIADVVYVVSSGLLNLLNCIRCENTTAFEVDYNFSHCPSFGDILFLETGCVSIIRYKGERLLGYYLVGPIRKR